ncbi:hypothetical protein ATL41_0154 [Flavimobilis soli]|uniref:Uncharacterized protein n=2 Tax=Flavimobilis soli TaxID=442709 RepID=A0A2A9E9E1_9MICO|nr:hypothetical protein ATL41_0154 [Flavimobilis soli]
MKRRGTSVEASCVYGWHMNGTDPVGEWLTVPDVAELLGTDISKVRGLLHERKIVGVKRGERSIFQVPARFFVPAHMANPADVGPAPENPEDVKHVVLAALPGTFVVLTDLGFSDEEIIDWLFTVEDSIGVAPIEALHQGRKSEVRRVAQALL